MAASLADQGEFPYVASIEMKDIHTCSGFIYDNHWIVTSASCIDESVKINKMKPFFFYFFSIFFRVPIADLVVTVGQLSLIYEDTDEESFPVRHIVIHPKYDKVTKKHNLALIRVRRKK